MGCLVETHAHTYPTSPCAFCSGAELIKAYKDAGYSVVFITDHLNNNTPIFRDDYATWEEKIDEFYNGYLSAKEEGDKLGVKVFFGFEIRFEKAEFLILNLTPEWLKRVENLFKMEAEEFFDLVHASGGFVIQAHPYREAYGITKFSLYPFSVDAIETFNARNIQKNDEASNRPNQLASVYANAFDLPTTVGSDQHDTNLDLCGMFFEEEVSTVEDFIRLVKERKGKAYIKGKIIE